MTPNKDRDAARQASQTRANQTTAQFHKVQPPVTFEVGEIVQALKDNEHGDAGLLKKALKDRFCYDVRRKVFYCFDGGHWQKDLEDETAAFAHSVLHGAYTQESQRQAAIIALHGEGAENDASTPEMAESIKATRNRAKRQLDLIESRLVRINTLRRIKSIVTLAATGRNSIAMPGDNWNADPWLLQAREKIIDLHLKNGGKSRPGTPQDYINKVSPTEWKGLNEPCPSWQAFINSIFDGNQELAHYMQRVLGAALLGKPSVQEFYVLYGAGRNGKGTMLETLKDVLGEDLASPIKTALIMDDKRGGSADPELLELQGKRIVWASESGANKKLDAEQVKLFTGGDTLSGRYNYSNEIINFAPTHSLFLLTNHKPRIPGTDAAIWDRLRLIPFTMRFVDNPNPNLGEQKKDPELKDKLINERSGILAWLVQGCLEWQEQGLNPPDIVREYSEEYRLDEDIIQNFINEECLLGPCYKAQAQDLYDAFEKWHRNTYGETTQIMTQKKFLIDLRGKPGIRREKHRVTFFYGIGLQSRCTQDTAHDQNDYYPNNDSPEGYDDFEF